MSRLIPSTLSVMAALAAGPALANGFNPAPAPVAPVIVEPAPVYNAFPGVFGAPSAVPPAPGSAYVALSYANPRGGIDGADADGDLAVGYTFGDAVDAVAVTAGVNVTGLDPFGDSGSFYASAARFVTGSQNTATFVGASISGLHGWGDAADDDVAYSLYLSHLVGVAAAGTEIPFQFVVGYGNQTTYEDDGSGDLTDGLIFGAGVGLTPRLSAGISATTTQLNIGGTMVFPELPGLSLTAGVYDVTDAVERQQFSLTAAFSF